MLNRVLPLLSLLVAVAVIVVACAKKEPTDLVVETLQTGTGDEAKPGQVVSVHYTGWLTNGTKFDSSLDRGTPFQFLLGAGQVIQGWDKGVAGMKIGEKRKLTIPSSLGYGDGGAGNVIPPKATLVFEVQLLGLADPNAKPAAKAKK